MNLSRLDWIAVAAYVAGGGLAATAAGLATILPHYQTQILAISAILIGVAGMIVRLIKNPTPTNTAQIPTSGGGTVTISTVQAPTPTAPPPAQKASP